MRIILLEGKNLEQTFQRYKDKLADILALENGREYSEDEVRSKYDTLIGLDPTYKEGSTTTGQFGEWILNSFIKEPTSFRSYSVKDTLNNFINIRNKPKLKQFLKSTDVMAYKTLYHLVDDLKNVDKKADEQRWQEIIDSATPVYEDDKWVVYSPNSYDESRAIGKDSRWCTAYKNNDQWYNKYVPGGRLWININKNDRSEQYQFYFNEKQGTQEPAFMDIADSPIDLVGFFEKNPQLEEFYKSVIPEEVFEDIVDNYGDYSAYFEMDSASWQGYGAEYAYENGNITGIELEALKLLTGQEYVEAYVEESTEDVLQYLTDDQTNELVEASGAQDYNDFVSALNRSGVGDTLVSMASSYHYYSGVTFADLIESSIDDSIYDIQLDPVYNRWGDVTCYVSCDFRDDIIDMCRDHNTGVDNENGRSDALYMEVLGNISRDFSDDIEFDEDGFYEYVNDEMEDLVSRLKQWAEENR